MERKNYRDESTAVDWATVQKWLRLNPRKSRMPPSASHSVVDDIIIPESLPNVWTQVPVIPSNPLSCILSALDIESYNGQSDPIRREILRRTCTDLQSRIETDLKGRAYPKAKTNEGLVEVSEKEHSPWSEAGMNALAGLYKIQMIVLNETDKTIKYIPEDVCAWSHETPIYYFAHNYRSIYMPPSGFDHTSVFAWLIEKDSSGWTATYKEVKGTITELTELAAANSIELPTGKVKKDVLIGKISKQMAWKTLMKWSLTK